MKFHGSLLSLVFPALVGVVTACAPTAPPIAQQDDVNAASEIPQTTHADAPVDAFLAAIAQHCGQAFAGRIVANTPTSTTPDAFEGQALVMHVRGCDAPTQELRIPFHVGDDHSRTWVLTRTADGLRLKHDHRHADGSPDTVTMYGGDTTAAGSLSRQEFPVDAESQAMFEREGMNVSLQNTWAIEVEAGKRFLYELSRPNGRLFQVEFDLSTPVALPPAPWGAETVQGDDAP